jgi:hypothetical protein
VTFSVKFPTRSSKVSPGVVSMTAIQTMTNAASIQTGPASAGTESSHRM